MVNVDGRRIVAATAVAGSLLVHAGLAVGLAMLPEPPPIEPAPHVDGIELVWLETPARVDPPRSPSPTTDVDVPSGETSAALPGPPERPKRSRAHAPREEDGSPGARPTPSPAGDPPTAAGLALSGLRGGTGRGASGAVAVVVPAPSEAIPAQAPRPTPRARSPEGPTLPPADREVRSLEEAGFRKRKDGSYKMGKLRSAFTATVHPDGRVSFRDRSITVNPVRTATGLLAPQRLAGEEQFRTLKTRLLRQTFELRMQMARSWSRKQMRKQLAALDRQLEAAWSRNDWSVQRRRRLLFTLWDDCLEASPKVAARESSRVEDSLDQARVEAGVKARKTVILFITTELPKGSADAYSKDELEALNRARKSRRRFAPYG